MNASFEAAAAGLPCGVVVTGVDGAIAWANEEFCASVGLAWPALEGRPLAERLVEPSRVVLSLHADTLLRVDGVVRELKLHLLHADGRAVPVLVNARGEGTGAARRVVYAVFVAHLRDRYEGELRVARNQAEELARERRRAERAQEDRAQLAEQLIGIVSHDLRNPLLTIRMATQAISRGAAAAPMLAEIEQAITRSQALIEDTLDFTVARLRGGMTVDLAPVDLHALVARQVAAQAVAYPEVELRHVAEGEGPCEADAARLAQLLANLIGNAVVYGDRARPVTVVSTIAAGCFALAVHNHGNVIPEELQGRIFQPLVRGGEPAVHGVGLGLFIVAQIVQAHSGEVAVQSTPAGGTTFTATFPR